jgi:TolB protein
VNRKHIKFAAAVVAVTAGVASPLVSPAHATYDGQNGRIAFRRFFNPGMTHGAVFTVNPDGTDEFQVTHPIQGFIDRNPDISPDGTRIAFEREGPRSDEIWVVNADGTGLRQLTRSKVGCLPLRGRCDGQPAWSPDGSQIAFSSGTGRVVDGLAKRYSIYVMDADGTDVRRITQRRLPAQGEDSDPMWSPDGTQLVFQRLNVRDALPRDGIALWTIDLGTLTEHRVTPWRVRAGDTPDWSPDGARILFHSNNKPRKDGLSANLYTIHPDGTGLRQLTFATGGVIQYLGSSYSPDGTMITYGRKPATGGRDLNAADVFTMWVDGSHKTPVTRTRKYDSYPDWGPVPRTGP